MSEIIHFVIFFTGLQKLRPYDSKDNQNPYQLNMRMSENNSSKLQFPVQEPSETTKLLPRSNQNVNLVEPSKKCQLLIILLLILTGVGLVAYISYNTTKLIVLNFNVWGMPGGIDGCEYKPERMEALADLIKSRTPYFDLFLLTELWMQEDHQLLEEAANSVGLHMTRFRQDILRNEPSTATA